MSSKTDFHELQLKQKGTIELDTKFEYRYTRSEALKK